MILAFPCRALEVAAVLPDVEEDSTPAAAVVAALHLVDMVPGRTCTDPCHARRPDLQEHLRPAVAAAADTAADPMLHTRLVLGQGHPDRDAEVVVVGAAQAEAEAEVEVEVEGGEDSKTTMTDDAAAAAVMTATRVEAGLEAREATDDDWDRVCFWAWMQNFVKLVVGVQVLGGVDSPSWGGVLVDQPVDVQVYWRWEWLTQESWSWSMLQLCSTEHLKSTVATLPALAELYGKSKQG